MKFEWNRNIQKIVDAIDAHIVCLSDGSLTLELLAGRLGYSPHYTTRQFHRLTGMRFRDYLRLRRLAFAAIELRDSPFGILNIAMRYGFASQEAFTRAFKSAFGINPGAYRRKIVPLALQTRANTFDPYVLGLGDSGMSSEQAKTIRVYSQRIPAHLLLHVRNYQSHGYWDFWRLQEAVPGQDCHTICGILDSIKGRLDGRNELIGQFSGHLMAYLLDLDGRRAEAYGIRLPADWDGVRPEQMQLTKVEDGEYMVFEHPAFDYQKIGATVHQNVLQTADGFDYSKTEYEPDRLTDRVEYFYFEPAKYCRIVRPVKRRERKQDCAKRNETGTE